jgi:hypothetical protein
VVCLQVVVSQASDEKTTIQYLIPKHDITKQDLQKMQSPTIKKWFNKSQKSAAPKVAECDHIVSRARATALYQCYIAT